MKIKLFFYSIALFLLSIPCTQADIDCSVSSPGFSAGYTGAQLITQTYFTLDCSRLSGDPNNSAYSIRADNGINAQGQQSQVSFGAYDLVYEEYSDSICNTKWQPSGGKKGAIEGVINFGGNLSISENVNFWSCVPASQAYAFGTYTDTVTMELVYDNGIEDITVFGTHLAAINTIASCSISSAPTSISFTYIAYQVTEAASSASFGATCTIGASYSISTDTASGVVSGLNYSLLINTSSSGGSNPLGVTGDGNQQNFFINAVMPAGQSGNCSTSNCADSNAHTLILSF